MKKFWKYVAETYEGFEAHHYHTLKCACEAHDKAEEARKILALDGVRIQDRYGLPKEHPCVKTEINNKKLWLQCIRELRLDHEEPDEIIGRPRIPEKTK